MIVLKKDGRLIVDMELIKLTEFDLPFLLDVRNHESTRFNLEDDSVFDLSQCKSWFKSLEDPWYIIKVNSIPVGYFRTKGDSVGCDIHPVHRRNGYARKAYEKYLKDKEYAELWVFNDNFAKGLYESLGFKSSNEHRYIRNRLYIKMEFKRK